MQLIKWFSLMKETVMCNNNLRLKSPLTRSTDHKSLLKHCNVDFKGGGGGGDSYLKPDFSEGRVTKIFNFALKIKGGGGREGGTCEVLRPCHPPKIWNVYLV